MNQPGEDADNLFFGIIGGCVLFLGGLLLLGVIWLICLLCS